MLNINRESGNISIDNEVFTYFAGEAATSCFGVKGMVACSKEGGPWQLLKRETMSKGVIVKYDDDNDSISLELHIGVDHGVNLAAVSSSIIKEVKYKLETATGVPVKSVDVFIDTIIK
ncbi:MAG: Asp23/Gls24 family envelope stress response protein [Oscillospiraceae bacterium]|nr:Asp23/Gls24 family envelope stress response protein [Oscillospiraceae bacterium]